ncbi:MAG TPA: hypothetical protein VH419_15840 [Nocardioidaceae bacterium]|jgi:hypothetical protein
MTDRVHVTMDLELFVDDMDAMRKAAYERMKSAWSSDDAFPVESPDDVALDQAVASLLADALPISVPGARRSQLAVNTAEPERLDDGEHADENGEQDDQTEDSDDSDEGDQGSDDDDQGSGDSDEGERRSSQD